MIKCFSRFRPALAAPAIISTPFVEVMEPSDQSQDRYYPVWLVAPSNDPVFQVRDLENKYGHYTERTKIVTFNNLIKIHDHVCCGDSSWPETPCRDWGKRADNSYRNVPTARRNVDHAFN